MSRNKIALPTSPFKVPVPKSPSEHIADQFATHGHPTQMDGLMDYYEVSRRTDFLQNQTKKGN